MGKVATPERGSHTAQKPEKKRKTRLHITLDEDVGEVLDRLYIRKSQFINDLLRIILFGEGDVMSFLESLWWARGDSNPGPPPCEGGVITSLDHGPARSSERVGKYKAFAKLLRVSSRVLQRTPPGILPQLCEACLGR
ncbi:SSV1 integrase homolog, N-fragment [Thermococcus kodakarensis KOD1]|uniref:SSV1 integrase homolog, N-fragment n=1 Tax=Thermococcus kodakarensis (strain ATCC BAA-918 / JCM 12380 / KOD1) TaxID=69014 RepID=Q5JFE8_THEKO|nr:SSV1 integrase homolog, N-fragment [Thermococcus kodakarensis KOD1]